MLVIFVFFMCYCSSQSLQSAPGDQAMLDDLFKDVDFEKIAKDMDQLFKEMEAEEKAKKTGGTSKPGSSQGSSFHQKTTPSFVPHSAPLYQSNKSHEELFLNPVTEPAPWDKKKDMLWITQESLDATNIILDKLINAVNTLSNKVIEYQIIPLDEFSDNLHNVDIIKVSCGIIKSKTTYKRMLLTPQIVSKELEKPIEQLRSTIVQTIKKTITLTDDVKEIPAEDRQKNDIDTLQSLAKKTDARLADQESEEDTNETPNEPEDDETVFTQDEEDVSISTTPEAPAISNKNQKGKLLTFFEQTLAPLAGQLGKFTQSPESKKAIEEKTAERELRMKEMENRIKNQQSNKRQYGSSDYYDEPPYRRNAYRPSFSPHGFPASPYPSAERFSSPQSSSYSPPHDNVPLTDKTTTVNESSKDSSKPIFYGLGKKDKKDDKEAKETTEPDAAEKLKREAREDAKINDAKIYDTLLATIASNLNEAGEDWELYNQRINDKLVAISSVMLAQHDKSDTLTVATLETFLPHLIYASAWDILVPADKTDRDNDSENGQTKSTGSSCKKLLDTLINEPILKKKPYIVTKAFDLACAWITDKHNPAYLSLDEPDDQTIKKIKAVIKRLGAPNVRPLKEALPKE